MEWILDFPYLACSFNFHVSVVNGTTTVIFTQKHCVDCACVAFAKCGVQQDSVGTGVKLEVGAAPSAME